MKSMGGRGGGRPRRPERPGRGGEGAEGSAGPGPEQAGGGRGCVGWAGLPRPALRRPPPARADAPSPGTAAVPVVGSPRQLLSDTRMFMMWLWV